MQEVQELQPDLQFLRVFMINDSIMQQSIIMVMVQKTRCQTTEKLIQVIARSTTTTKIMISMIVAVNLDCKNQASKGR